MISVPSPGKLVLYSLSGYFKDPFVDHVVNHEAALVCPSFVGNNMFCDICQGKEVKIGKAKEPKRQ